MGTCRPSIGKIDGALATVSAVELGAVVISEFLKRSGVAVEQIAHELLRSICNNCSAFVIRRYPRK